MEESEELGCGGPRYKHLNCPEVTPPADSSSLSLPAKNAGVCTVIRASKFDKCQHGRDAWFIPQHLG